MRTRSRLHSVRVTLRRRTGKQRAWGRRCAVATALACVVALSLVAATAPASQASKASKVLVRTGPCAGMRVHEENHDSIRLSVDRPGDGARPDDGRGRNADQDQAPKNTTEGSRHGRIIVDPPTEGAVLAVDEHGRITVGGIVKKHTTMVDVTDGQVTTSDFAYGPAPRGVPPWVSSWTASLRPPHLGTNLLCVRATDAHRRDDHQGDDHQRYARILRSFTVVDQIPPSSVPGLSVGSITAAGATVTWGAATDNYGLSGYSVTVDGGTAHRTTVGTRRYVVAGLSPSTRHTVSVVAIDLAGNTSAPATAAFTTAASPPPPPPPPPPGNDLTVTPEEGSATATWHPNPAQDVTYRAFLDGQLFADFPLAQYCQDAAGKPANPCTAQDVISFPVTPLEQATSYTFRFDSLHADGSAGRTLSAPFTTSGGPDVVPEVTRQEIASDSSLGAGLGGTFYVAPTARPAVSVPGGSTQLFTGCYRVANSTCIDALLPPSGDKLLDCSDDFTGLLFQLAPSGRGPVISSLEGTLDGVIAPPIPTPRIPIEPITWCTNGACTVVLETAEETAEAAAIATVSEAAVSAVVVFAAAVAIVTVLKVVLDIVFAEELGIAGLFEYPIRYDTNFDTFDNWGANKGTYYDSLKIYAEVIKTTTLYSQRYNLPFAWNEPDDQNFKRSVDRACSAQQGQASLETPYGCGDGLAVYVPGGKNYQLRDMSQTGRHIVNTMSDTALTANPARVQWFYPAYSLGGQAAIGAGYNRGWFNRADFKPNNCDNRVAMACDEYPFWTTNQAVDLSGTRADLAPTPRLESNAQGNELSQFYSKCEVKDTDHFLVLPIASWVQAGGPGFGFRVAQGGASLCLIPTGGP